MAEKIQPMALRGRWATIKAPTTMKALNPAAERPDWWVLLQSAVGDLEDDAEDPADQV
jgi:hypothetical protein